MRLTADVKIWLGDLVERTMTRARGQEAARLLRSKAKGSDASRVYLDMNVDHVVTASFVDELVQRAAEMARNDGIEIVFVVLDDQMIENFQKSVTWRNLPCRYRRPGHRRMSTLKPGQKPPTKQPVRSDSKASMATAV